MSSSLKIILKTITGYIPYPSRKKIFCRNKISPDKPGPNRFLYNIANAFHEHDLKFERNFIFKCRSALFLSNSLGDSFIRMCKTKNIKTVLRVDGFYPPSVFNNKEHSYHTKRDLNLTFMDTNQRMQKDIALCDWIVYQSKFSKKMADFFLFNRTENYSIIYNGVDIHHFKPLHNKINKKPRLLIFGSFRDADLMIGSLNAYAEIRKTIDADLKIIGPMTADVKTTTDKWIFENSMAGKEIDQKGKIEFEKLPQELSECDLSLHLKPGDWCPNAVIETLSCGIPVVCQQYGGTKEIVGDAGEIINYKPYVYDERFIKKCADQALKVLSGIPQYKKLARKRAVENFNIGSTAEEYRHLLAE